MEDERFTFANEPEGVEDCWLRSEEADADVVNLGSPVIDFLVSNRPGDIPGQRWRGELIPAPQCSNLIQITSA